MSKYGYMCYTDYRHEIGEAPNGIDVYRSIEDLTNNRKCVSECGIVKVKIELEKVLVSDSFIEERTLKETIKQAKENDKI